MIRRLHALSTSFAQIQILLERLTAVRDPTAEGELMADLRRVLLDVRRFRDVLEQAEAEAAFEHDDILDTEEDAKQTVH